MTNDMKNYKVQAWRVQGPHKKAKVRHKPTFVSGDWSDQFFAVLTSYLTSQLGGAPMFVVEETT
jgi:hypothetical protein